MDKIFSVCWNLTSRCNQSCRFCFRDTTEKELSISENMDILNELISYGIKKISFTGGEVTLYNDLWKLAEHAHSHGVYTNVITNGSTITEDFCQFLPLYVDCLTLPLDALDINLQERMGRGLQHNECIFKLLSVIKNKQLNIDIKINSVATKYNVDEIRCLYPILCNFDVKYWKIFQFTPLRFHAKANSDDFNLNDIDFRQLKASLCEQNELFNKPIKLIFQSSNEITDSYTVILSDGTISDIKGSIQKTTRSLCSENFETLIKNTNFNFCNYYKRHPVGNTI